MGRHRRSGWSALVLLPWVSAATVFASVLGALRPAPAVSAVPDPLALVPGHGPGSFRSDAAGRNEVNDPSPRYTPEERRHLAAFGHELFFSTTAWGQRPSQGPEVRGERLSCAACHSGPGLTDGRTHLVGPVGARDVARRQTPHLFALGGTAPFGWDGRNPTLRHQSRGAIVSPLEMHGSREPTRHELDALAEFMLTLTPPPAEPGVDFDPVKAARGEQLFRQTRPVVDPGGEFGPNAKVACATCHTGRVFTDNKPHRIAPTPFGDPADPGQLDRHGRSAGFDTPALMGVRFGSPYFHAGHSGDPTAPTEPVAARQALRTQLLPAYNSRFQFRFTASEIDDLTEFLLSL